MSCPSQPAKFYKFNHFFFLEKLTEFLAGPTVPVTSLILGSKDLASNLPLKHILSVPHLVSSSPKFQLHMLTQVLLLSYTAAEVTLRKAATGSG
jgi:hypothetical protein